MHESSFVLRLFPLLLILSNFVNDWYLLSPYKCQCNANETSDENKEDTNFLMFFLI